MATAETQGSMLINKTMTSYLFRDGLLVLINHHSSPGHFAE